MVWKFRYTLGTLAGVSLFFAFHNPFGFWKFFGLLSIGVGLAIAISSILIFLIERNPQWTSRNLK
jgi:hypothetical protein